MRNQEWNATLAELHTLDLAQLVLGFLAADAVDREATLCVVDKTKLLASLLDADDVHETGRVCGISANFAVNPNQALHHDLLDFSCIECILEAGLR